MEDRNYALVFAYLKKHPELTKEDIAHQYSKGRTRSLRELGEVEYRAMLRDLHTMLQDVEALRKARSVALSLLQRYGIDTQDWARINHFCEQARIAGKPFAPLSIEELQGLSRKLRSIIYKERKRGGKKPEVLERGQRKSAPTLAIYDKMKLIGEA